MRTFVGAKRITAMCPLLLLLVCHITRPGSRIHVQAVVVLVLVVEVVAAVLLLLLLLALVPAVVVLVLALLALELLVLLDEHAKPFAVESVFALATDSLGCSMALLCILQKRSSSWRCQHHRRRVSITTACTITAPAVR